MYFLSKSSTAIGTITQGPDVPIPLPPDSIDTIVLSDEESSEETISESDFETEHKNTPQLFTQCELNDLVLDQGLSKLGAEKYVANEWKLFIDSAKKSLKGVLPYNGTPMLLFQYFIILP
ncbi:hypothetical protein T06_5152 [Trichinella sp. T6]|nr:hypothetical protein T06_5152 [Trichinella sp. T6]